MKSSVIQLITDSKATVLRTGFARQPAVDSPDTAINWFETKTKEIFHNEMLMQKNYKRSLYEVDVGNISSIFNGWENHLCPN